jgi:hypothetical protein
MIIIRWLLIWEVGVEQKTRVFIIPAAKHISAPYPVTCRLTVLPQNPSSLASATSVMLEGPKVGQPSEFILEDILPPIEATNQQCVGLLIELFPSRRSLDLSPSRCVVDIFSDTGSLRYAPWELEPIIKPARPEYLISERTQPVRVKPFVVKDTNRVSLVGINSSQEDITASFGFQVVKASGTPERLEENSNFDSCVALSLPPFSCREWPLEPVVPENKSPTTPRLINEIKPVCGLLNAHNDDVAFYVIEKNGLDTVQVFAI